MSMYGNSNKRPVIRCGPSRVQKQYEYTFHPQKMIEKYGRQTLLKSLKQVPQLYSDAPNPYDYKESLDVISKADQAFAALPSAVRVRFNNDPLELLQFLQDPKNQQEAYDLGLSSTAPAPEPPAKSPEPEKSKSKSKSDKNLEE